MVIETSHAIADVAVEPGISEPGDWARVYRKKHARDEPPLQLSERPDSATWNVKSGNSA